MTLTQRSRRSGIMVLAMVALVPMAAVANGIAWNHSYATARNSSVQTGKPILVSVSSRGCGWCKQLERTTFRDPRVVEMLNGQTVPLKIDANDPAHESLVEALGLQAVPTLAAITADGRIVANQTGYLDAREFLSWIRPVVGPAR
ncbi:thioredoxin family protein [Tautonia marina]|uniref:thioredoxin family protein n=1 Tax=Tautonia marina TaxID=2653855 RepID=UPI001260C774|nr:thioredoxin fold domain-containing protein [Tautonia marina]